MYHKQNTIEILEKKSCYFCRLNIGYIDYKESELLRKFVSMQAKIKPVRRSKCCAKHQRALALAIKRARFMALMPYTNL
ncbi:30S ribosomal protein S18 [Candidatus Azambacteria bacterium RIFCSPLOWO2_01_FULL_37_9]|uniref:Small ribosomal subunit protein bS18 n=1 Tax=Candidatus Azambacteria bacterium RIFCSPLOWO2_01_FULL_37_9 TaxID=1797297 RepID=A0A1F5C8D0_9BACT|nr:MAG: 30S ribosomal protein S18 [Candidatus Azambacteria bacterium RIFCSPLOWO2_01_FULL_37_9]